MVYSSFHNSGASFAMNDSQNNNFVGLDPVDHFIGKSFDEVLPCSFIFRGMDFWISFYELKTSVNLQ